MSKTTSSTISKNDNNNKSKGKSKIDAQMKGIRAVTYDRKSWMILDLLRRRLSEERQKPYKPQDQQDYAYGYGTRGMTSEEIIKQTGLTRKEFYSRHQLLRSAFIITKDGHRGSWLTYYGEFIMWVAGKLVEAEKNHLYKFRGLESWRYTMSAKEFEESVDKLLPPQDIPLLQLFRASLSSSRKDSK